MTLQLDYFYGQVIEDVFQYGEEEWQWAIRFSGGAVVKNDDERNTFAPIEAKGKGFQTTIMSQYDTKLALSDGSRITLTPTRYTISQEGSEEERPQWPEELPAPQVLKQMDEEAEARAVERGAETASKPSLGGGAFVEKAGPLKPAEGESEPQSEE